MHSQTNQPSLMESSHDDGLAVAPSGSVAAACGFTLLAGLPAGHDVLSRPLGEIGASCRNKLGKEWRDVSRWSIARSSFDLLGNEWKSTSEFRVASETLLLLESEVAARRSIEQSSDELLVVPADEMDPDWARDMVATDLAALAGIRGPTQRLFATVAMGYSAVWQSAYRDELMLLAPAIWAEVQQAHAEDLRRIMAKEKRKALELLPASNADVVHGIGPVPVSTLTTLPTGYQLRAREWAAACFGEQVASDPSERNHRFLEEALELAQAGGATAVEAHLLVDYVFGRPVGDFPQEVGGTMLTLALLCQTRGESMEVCGEVELARVWQKLEQIRVKQAAKKADSPLPGGHQVIPSADGTSLGSSQARCDGVEFKASELNHLRRLLAWVACEIGQAPDELVKTVQGLLPALGHEVADEAKQRLVQAHREAVSVPRYVRAAVKALGKRVGAHCDLEDAESLDESEPHPT